MPWKSGKDGNALSSEHQETGHGWQADHPLRHVLHNEIHARPYEELAAPLRISHLAMFSGHEAAAEDRAAVTALCRRFGVAGPDGEATHLSADFGPFRLKWERRTEFSTYTVYVPGNGPDPFHQTAIQAVPGEWLRDLLGQRLAALHIFLAASDAAGPEPAEVFGADPLVGSRVSDGAARVWTDFRIHEDGFSRFLVQDEGLGRMQAGRVIQRLLELESYRMMALLAFPLARDLHGELAELEERLAALNRRLTGAHGLQDERSLLRSLSAQAAEVERVGNTADYRLNASGAYHDLVRRRIEELREELIPGCQTIRGFLHRRLEPAMRTCRSAAERQESLSRRIARTGELLQTRVNVGLDERNRDLLASMDRRARLQLRLQQTVEGLSVMAISYYATSLLHYLLSGAADAGAPVRPAPITAIAVPFVVAAVWLGIRAIRVRVTRRKPAPEDSP